MAAARVPRLVYLHGFRSSPQSFKARLLERRLAQAGLAARFACPQLPPSPARAVRLVTDEFDPQPHDTLVGSSLGGFYATWIAERTGCRAVLLNPAVTAARDLAAHVGVQALYHGDGEFVFEAAFLDELARLEVAAPTRRERYLLVAAKGDELLDWRDMVAKFPGEPTLLLEGGDHGLSCFADLIERVIEFARLDPPPSRHEPRMEPA